MRCSGLCSWESSQPPKLTDWVQILAGLLSGNCQRGRTVMQLFCKQPHGGSIPSAGLMIEGVGFTTEDTESTEEKTRSKSAERKRSGPSVSPPPCLRGDSESDDLPGECDGQHATLRTS
jgi:hypothetical protein